MSLSNMMCGYKKFESKIILMLVYSCGYSFASCLTQGDFLFYNGWSVFLFYIYTGRIYKISTKFIMICNAGFFIFISTANRFNQGWIAFEKLISNIMGRNMLEIGSHVTFIKQMN